MLKQIEGSHAMAEAITLCRPEVICAYQITPQTHIVEGLGELIKDGTLVDCEYINVESEFAALSVAIPHRPRAPAPTRRRRRRACCSWQKPFTTPRASGCRS
jgi:Pyruvate flavodoxin/ferredoxin oxidoreductase, thiamine diP-bdg